MVDDESKIQPGSWRDAPDEPSGPTLEAPPIEAEPRPDLVARYLLFQQNIKPKADVVYHPCSANDVSPSVAFPDSRVIYVDIHKDSMDALQKDGFEAHEASALEFDPGPVDILIMLNPQISPDVPGSHVVNGGYVLTNDYHATASTLHQNKQYTLRAIIWAPQGKEPLFDTENLEDYWKEIETEEEFKNAPFNWGTANYGIAVKVVEAVTGKRENVLAEYKKIIETARRERRHEYEKIAAEHPEMAMFATNLNDESILPFNFDGKQFVVPTTLPKKKGTVDDIFVFQKLDPKAAVES